MGGGGGGTVGGGGKNSRQTKEAGGTEGTSGRDEEKKGGGGGGRGGGGGGAEKYVENSVDEGGRGRIIGSRGCGGAGVEDTEQAWRRGEPDGRSGNGIQKKPSEPMNEETSKAMQLAVELLAKEGIPDVEELVRQAACNPSYGSDDQNEEAISDFELCDFCKNKGHPCCMSCLMKATSSSKKTVNMGGNIHGFSP